MKIIDIGICTNNNDPKGIGRIRYRPYGSFVSEIEKAIPYEDWDENDQFIAIPFLPGHLNVIPQLRQSVKLIKYDTDKDTQNVEYVSGPFSTPHNFGGETFTGQHKNTTYGGVIVKDLPDVRNKDGKFIDKKSYGTLANINDTGLYGNYGSDILFTEDGLVLRGGKLISKETTNNRTRQRLSEVPLLSDKMSKITLKKFPKTLNVVDQEVTTTKTTISKIKYIVEYDVNDFISPSLVRFFVYKIINSQEEKYSTDRFSETTEIDITNTKVLRLINTDNSITSPTIQIPVLNINEVFPELRNFLYTIDEKNLSEIDISYSNEDVHPFFFRPTKEFRLRLTNNETELRNKNLIFSNTQIRGSEIGSSLVFSKITVSPPSVNATSVEKILKEENTPNEQTFASMSSDIIYLLSTDTNKGKLLPSIDFKTLDQYEFTQEDYLTRIEPGTYAIVRGESLISLLNLLYEFTVGHVHNINEPPIYKQDIEEKLSQAINNMTNDLLNKSIRIN